MSDRPFQCAFCGAPLTRSFADLGMQPLCENFLTSEQLHDMEPFYPLHAFVCDQCFLVQVPAVVPPEDIFTDYAYFSSYSQSWLDHATRYTDEVVDRFGLSERSFVIELASNDGYLLKNFVDRGIPCLGVEPASNVAEAAVQRGVPTLVKFFGMDTAAELAAEGRLADLVIGNNVFAHVPTPHDFVGAIAQMLKPDGVLTLEFPHLVRLIEGNQFDTIYHEHFFYFSFATARRVLEHHGIRVFDVEELPTHGGSLRVFACLQPSGAHAVTARVAAMEQLEARYGVEDSATYDRFDERVLAVKMRLLDFLIAAKNDGKRTVAYGAPGKGNTLLNFCGIRTDLIDYAVDLSEYKQGRFTPGTHIPIFPPDRLRETKPDFVLILPWNLQDEITRQHSYIFEWGGRFVVPIPETRVLEQEEVESRRSNLGLNVDRDADTAEAWLPRAAARAPRARRPAPR
jgi:SAM-dependent methyltransferase